MNPSLLFAVLVTGFFASYCLVVLFLADDSFAFGFAFLAGAFSLGFAIFLVLFLSEETDEIYSESDIDSSDYESGSALFFGI